MTGLKGLTYLDKSQDPKKPAKKSQDQEHVAFGQGLVDSVYLNAPDHVELEVGTGQYLHLRRAVWQYSDILICTTRASRSYLTLQFWLAYKSRQFLARLPS